MLTVMPGSISIMSVRIARSRLAGLTRRTCSSPRAPRPAQTGWTTTAAPKPSPKAKLPSNLRRPPSAAPWGAGTPLQTQVRAWQ